jgi:hypothetical protein
MNARLVITVGTLFLTPLAPAAEEAPKSSARELLRARVTEDAKKTDPKKTPTPPAKTATPAEPVATETKAPPTPTKEAPTVLPKVEVRKDRVTELDQKLAKQDQDIAREKKNLKSSELDGAINDVKIAKPLAIFGGDSTQFRKGVASERVELMEAEKDIMEAIAHAKTKEEKASLQKQLDQLKALRRELDKTMR